MDSVNVKRWMVCRFPAGEQLQARRNEGSFSPTHAERLRVACPASSGVVCTAAVAASTIGHHRSPSVCSMIACHRVVRSLVSLPNVTRKVVG